ncbi:bifunctional [glutamate--ammonia ligase]-adenylyl-L-tyrosine phosphorylase/[glutamate--ammonia-ligase] adenylyltransferase [Seongchinamella sediminis]|uniref:Bifunctional glutamine synthetase adenylyltransferase/adenylyl-removing enzyme n=1 Tax=Seongchinamella sediminis TaxID=2283635 RepID=A0A3L7DZN2_9GAMM|nr:bifunctional [glutamate--ammonia ligase]-adenylyl-L-tyrosine phosphorylase/[glutamate--ammonia-ligase] adenylyltransferase [Seongchinamella sediminis]RLQ22125.1 bifunctional [glutamate--ammonia ligase]-adenylyl-L-tyrosine phosphorylase/[glutamate--ammonia-ligase] adenylyltransferase [Seongchinamella sediminis]
MSLVTEHLPGELAPQALTAWGHILERASAEEGQALQAATAAAPLSSQLATVLACSPFVAGLARRKPAMLLDLLQGDSLQQSLPDTAFREQLQAALEPPEVELGVVLRCFRQRHMLRIVWRDFCRLADTLETVRDTSLLAEACIDIALGRIQAELEKRFGRPLGRSSGQPQRLIVLAMGKLGARELNVSSDIDLIFAFPEAGSTDGEKRQISNEEFFTRVGQGLITALDQVTPEGFVFRVDMRLRPYGESGALVHNFHALEEYYQDQGRDWERYALIKARPVSGDPRYAEQLMQSLRPFVYRRYVDFGVIESLRGMKQMISAEVRRRGLDDNVKLGHGGIREIEFIAQCFQLIRGGRDLGLQQRELLVVLEECVDLGCLPREVAGELRAAYLFLRDSEHAIQGYQDKQTQELPADAVPRQAMAHVMGFPAWDAFAEALGAHRQRVSAHFSNLIAPPEDEQTPAEALEDVGLWADDMDADSLAELGYQDPEQSLQLLQDFRGSGRVVSLQAVGRERLDQFMPLLLRACAEVEQPDLALQRLLPLVVAVARRSAYLVLLVENPPALGELVSLCIASPWIADLMSRHPALLDEFLDRSSLYTAPDKEVLRCELSQQVARLATDDLEAQMDALRYFKASQVLRVAASEIAGRLPVMKVSDNLTWIAEVILEQVLAVAWADLTRKYGEPQREGEGYGFAVFGYGKLGGIELGYGSDLDLVFIQDGVRGATDGERGIDNTVFYMRLAQRMIHILEARMSLGQLYEVDMRLRPDGDSGSLVPSVEGFASYQQNNAWTWEHQALVRARFAAGDPRVAERVEQVREEALCRVRDPQELALDVVKMRRRMREHLLPREVEDTFNLKQGTGGMVDIEFMVQYAVLAWASSTPALARWSDNVRILEVLGNEGLLAEDEAAALTQAYLDYRGAAHQLALQQLPGEVPAELFASDRARVSAQWQALLGAAEQEGSES